MVRFEEGQLRHAQAGAVELGKLRRGMGTAPFLRALGIETSSKPVGFRDFPIDKEGIKVPVLNIGRIPIFTKLTRTGDNYTSVERPQGAIIVPILFEQAKPYVLLIDIHRGSVDSRFTEIPSGQLLPGESAKECADRELGEETGYKILKVIRDFKSPSYSGPDFTTDAQRTIIVEVKANGTRDLSADDSRSIVGTFLVPLSDAADMAATQDRLPGNDLGDTKSTRAVLAAARLLGV